MGWNAKKATPVNRIHCFSANWPHPFVLPQPGIGAPSDTFVQAETLDSSTSLPTGPPVWCQKLPVNPPLLLQPTATVSAQLHHHLLPDFLTSLESYPTFHMAARIKSWYVAHIPTQPSRLVLIPQMYMPWVGFAHSVLSAWALSLICLLVPSSHFSSSLRLSPIPGHNVPHLCWPTNYLSCNFFLEYLPFLNCLEGRILAILMSLSGDRQALVMLWVLTLAHGCHPHGAVYNLHVQGSYVNSRLRLISESWN